MSNAEPFRSARPVTTYVEHGGSKRLLRSGGFWVAVFGLLLGVGLAWLLITGLLARREVSKAESAINGARASISAGDITTAIGQSDQIRAHAHRAHELTTGPAWWIASKIPLLGKPVVSVRGCATAADALGNQVLQPLVRTAGSLNLNQLVDHGTVNVQPLAQAAPVVSAARLNLIAASAIVGDLPQSTWLGTVDRARASFHTSLTKLQGQLNSLDRVTSILPQMLGTDRTMHYFVGLENEAESRGVGGIPGAFAIVTADRGKLSFTRFESDTTLYRVRTDLKLGAEYNQRYGVADPTSTYANSTISPDFRDAAQIWAAMWQKYSGQKVDGAIAIDPTAISYLLKVTGPAELADGTSVGADSVVALTQKTLYATYPDANQRKAYLLKMASAISARLISAPGSPALIKAASKAVAERRLLVWSAQQSIEDVLRQTAVAGTLEPGNRPFAGFTTTNAVGGKLDYYLQRSMTYQRTGCG
ncbi:MAG: hypothetical protein QOH56_4082, partial [Pseudonocardiales bacterium]|nr:hypothetical protein [Pseudonocardiales bacterium]